MALKKAAWFVAALSVAASWLMVDTARATTTGPSDDGQAAFDRGLAADLGQGQPADPALAIHYYLISAEQGDPDAELNLAVMTDSGVGTRADSAAAALWYGRAAAHDVGRAAYDLGQLYEDGVGVPRNRSLAANWFGRAASEGIVVAATRQRALQRMRDTDAPDLSAPRTLAPAADATLGHEEVEFVWQPTASVDGLRYWVQVIAIDDPGHTIAYQQTDVSSLVITLPATNRYVWRVFAASPSSGRYQASPWSAFALVHRGGCCLASLTNR